MTDDLLKQRIAAIQCPGKVDVVSAVMDEVRRRPLLAAVPSLSLRKVKWVAAAVAACVVVPILMNIVSTFGRQYNTGIMADDIASVYDYHAGYGDNGSYYEAYLVDVLLD